MWWRDLVQCPTCKNRADPGSGCPNCGPFLCAADQPVLVNFSESVIRREDIERRGGASPVPRRRRSRVRQTIERIIKGTNLSAARIAQTIATTMPQARVLIIGGAEIGEGVGHLYGRDLKILSCDIYPSASTDLIADAHTLPFQDCTFDVVWIQAVLEHVLDPPQVVAEIHRVLDSDGVVYAGTPFMQQVHEGPYDFTRFTLSGHRWLFRCFQEIESGIVGGAGTSLIWSVRYFWRALIGNQTLANLATLPIFWVRFFDRPTQRHANGANGVYFFGRKSATPLSRTEIIEYYTSR